MAGDERFFVRGVAYQPGGAADAQDPLLDTEALTADIEMFKELGINTIRIYTVDNSGNHDEAMRMLDEAGIYLALDASTPKYSSTARAWRLSTSLTTPSTCSTFSPPLIHSQATVSNNYASSIVRAG